MLFVRLTQKIIWKNLALFLILETFKLFSRHWHKILKQKMFAYVITLSRPGMENVVSLPPLVVLLSYCSNCAHVQYLLSFQDSALFCIRIACLSLWCALYRHMFQSFIKSRSRVFILWSADRVERVSFDLSTSWFLCPSLCLSKCVYTEQHANLINKILGENIVQCQWSITINTTNSKRWEGNTQVQQNMRVIVLNRYNKIRLYLEN